MTSATERLRALLDERGVGWTTASGSACYTAWATERGMAQATDYGEDGGVLSVLFRCDPEQAVDATLGPGTCEVVSSTLHEYEGGYAGSEWEHELSCGHTVWWGSGDAHEWCPWCEKRVVE